MDLSFPELVVVGIVAVLVWGKNLPGAARKLSRHYSRFRGYLADMRAEFERHASLEPEEPVEPPPIEPSPRERRRKGRPRKRRRGRRAS